MNKAGLMKNKLAEKDQVRMIVKNVSPNIVERLKNDELEDICRLL